MSVKIEEVSLKENCFSIQYGYTQSASDEKVGPKFLRITDIQDKIINWHSVPYCKISVEDYKKYKLADGDILIARTGASTGTNAIYREGMSDTVFASYLIRIRLNQNLAPRFVYYFLQSPTYKKHIESIIGGSAQPNANAQQLTDISIPLFPLPEQRAIASILGSLDDKIALNRSMNSTLEAIGQALFRRWFVDFEFPNEDGKPYRSSCGEMEKTELGEVPRGWRVGTIENLCVSITNGGTPKRMESRYWKGGTIPWYKTGELFDQPLLDSEEHITEEGLKESSCHLWEPNTILIALYASPTVGRLGLLKTHGTANQACSGLVAKPDVGYAFLFFTLLFKRGEFNMVAVGSAQQNISQQIVKDQKVVIPSPEITLRFQRSIEPFFGCNTSNVAESRTLATIRDALLPKLMSGEIRVNVE